LRYRRRDPCLQRLECGKVFDVSCSSVVKRRPKFLGPLVPRDFIRLGQGQNLEVRVASGEPRMNIF